MTDSCRYSTTFIASATRFRRSYTVRYCTVRSVSDRRHTTTSEAKAFQPKKPHTPCSVNDIHINPSTPSPEPHSPFRSCFIRVVFSSASQRRLHLRKASSPRRRFRVRSSPLSHRRRTCHPSPGGRSARARALIGQSRQHRHWQRGDR